MRPSAGEHKTLYLFFSMILFSACGGDKPLPEVSERADDALVSEQQAVGPGSEHENAMVPDFESLEAEIKFYIGKLGDRSFTSSYGHGYTWYTAAESLGAIGKPAIPHLIAVLQTDDAYELKLALYALQLASQDRELMASTQGVYIQLQGTVLAEEYNTINRDIALQWWADYNQLWR